MLQREEDFTRKRKRRIQKYLIIIYKLIVLTYSIYKFNTKREYFDNEILNPKIILKSYSLL